jgi:hypothetical protein
MGDRKKIVYPHVSFSHDLRWFIASHMLLWAVNLLGDDPSKETLKCGFDFMKSLDQDGRDGR